MRNTNGSSRDHEHESSRGLAVLSPAKAKGRVGPGEVVVEMRFVGKFAQDACEETHELRGGMVLCSFDRHSAIRNSQPRG